MAKKYNQAHSSKRVIITDVDKFRATDRAFLEAGDIIDTANGVPIKCIDDFMQVISELTSEDWLYVKYIRKRERFFALREC